MSKKWLHNIQSGLDRGAKEIWPFQHNEEFLIIMMITISMHPGQGYTYQTSQIVDGSPYIV